MTIAELLSYLRGWWPHWLMLLRTMGAPGWSLYLLLALCCLRTLRTVR